MTREREKEEKEREKRKMLKVKNEIKNIGKEVERQEERENISMYRQANISYIQLFSQSVFFSLFLFALVCL